MSPIMRLLLLVMPMFGYGCGVSSEAPRNGRDVSTQMSPSKEFEAVVRMVDISGSVGVSQPFQVLIRQAGGPSDWWVVLVADKTEGIRIQWQDERNLQICYDDARIYGFRNSYAAVSENRKSLSEVEIKLVKRKSLQECGQHEI